MRREKLHSCIKGLLLPAIAIAMTVGTLPAHSSPISATASQFTSTVSGPFSGLVSVVAAAYHSAKPQWSSRAFVALKADNESPSRSGVLDEMSTGSIPKSFFGTVAVPFSSIAVRAQWERVRLQRLPVASACKTDSCKERVAALQEAAARGKSLGFAAKLALANTTVNRVIAYKSDRSIYGKMDYWAASVEMVRKGAGDCEDFAILKQTLLRSMGVPDKSLSIIILKDTARNLYHAVLGVSTNQGNLVLDNVRGSVFRDTQVSNYQPLFSFSGNRSWVHGTTASDPLVASRDAVPLNAVAPGESAANPIMQVSVDFKFSAELRPTVRN